VACGGGFRNAEFVPRVCSERLFRHQLVGDLARKLRVDAALYVDPGKFVTFECRLASKLRSLAREIGLLGVGLRTD
jgi:hypothetical protein